MNFQIGQAVTRNDGDYLYYGKRGNVVEIEEVTGRIRVMWLNRDGSNDKRTWIKPTSLTASENLTDEMIAANLRAIKNRQRW